nr:MAG: methylthiotransferase, radical SAM superfamily [uncultured archaeon]
MGTEGTKEWADWNFNIFKGCPNNCRYCYAKFMALRFKRIKTLDEWQNPILNKKVFFQTYKKKKGRGMFPTSHDITPSTFTHCGIALIRLLQAGNEVLITTKPDFNLIKMLCKKIKPYKDQVQFRFTITSIDDKLLQYWEKNAPNYQSRKDSLIYAFREGFKTSVSIEPFLDPNPIPLINDIWLYCTESIWLGIMNPKYIKYKYHTYDYVKIVVQEIVETFSIAYSIVLEKLRLKDSIRNMGISL